MLSTLYYIVLNLLYLCVIKVSEATKKTPKLKKQLQKNIKTKSHEKANNKPVLTNE